MTDGEWFAPREIRFNRRTTIWLLENLGTLQSGIWPPEASNYTDANIRKKGVSRRAPSATPIEYYTEITDRLEKCGIDGLVLLSIESWGESEDSMARYLGETAWRIKKRYKQALKYVASGPARRWHDSYDKKGKLKRKGETYREFEVRKKESGKPL